jgi:hypothetical protein
MHVDPRSGETSNYITSAGDSGVTCLTDPHDPIFRSRRSQSNRSFRLTNKGSEEFRFFWGDDDDTFQMRSHVLDFKLRRSRRPGKPNMQGTNCDCNTSSMTAAAEAREASREKAIVTVMKQCRRRLCKMQASSSPLSRIPMHGRKHASFSVGGLRQFLGQFIAVSPQVKALEGFLMASPRSAMVFAALASLSLPPSQCSDCR